MDIQYQFFSSDQVIEHKKTRRSGLDAGALRMPDTKSGGDFSPPMLLTLFNFVG